MLGTTYTVGGIGTCKPEELRGYMPTVENI